MTVHLLDECSRGWTIARDAELQKSFEGKFSVHCWRGHAVFIDGRVVAHRSPNKNQSQSVIRSLWVFIGHTNASTIEK